MARKLTVLTAMLAMLLAIVVPALAQEEEKASAPGQYAGEEISVTGVVENLGSNALPPYGLRDEATGGVYYLDGDVDFAALEGERIIAYGTPEEVVRSVVLNVTRVEPADGPPGPPPGEETATLTFELDVEGDPPADATFFGNVQTGEGGPGAFVPLTDPDDDGLYTGSTTTPRFGPGPQPVPPGVEPLSFGVRIVQGTGTRGNLPGEPITTIRDFGTVQMNDQTFSARVSFDGDEEPVPGQITATGTLERAAQRGEGPTPVYVITDEDSGTPYELISGFVDLEPFVSGRVTITGVPVPGPGAPGAPRLLNVTEIEPADDSDGSGSGGNGSNESGSGSDDSDGSDNSGSGSSDSSGSGSGDSSSGGSDSGSGGSGSGSSDSSGSDSSGGSSGGVTESIRSLLPSTGGGMALSVLGAGVLLIGGGLLVHRIFR